MTDALGQVKTYSYAKDDLPLGVAYTAAVNPTPNVGFAYDAIGRLVPHAGDLGSFTLSYLGQTGQITGRALAGIDNTGLVSGQYSNYAYTTTPENFISAITETSDASAVYPASGTQTATYNNLNQLTNLSGQALTFDANGNLTSDGQRTYSWDAENRLVGIAYPAVPGKATAFTYDGLGRRTAITSTPPAGGGTVTTNYLWCDSEICQARNAANAPIRSYYDEGEYLPGTPAQTLYYGIDQIGSIRRVFASTTSASAYSFDPYGVPLQVTAPVTDYVYGGMFYNADSHLYLTKYRVFNPVAGRWLSRDPIGESADPARNLYSYVGGIPVSLTDPDGRMIWPLPWRPRPSAGACPIPPGWQLPSTSYMEGDSDRTDTGPGGATPPLPQPPRPEGIPENWIEKPSKKGGGTIYENPDNPNDRVRVMPGNPNSPNPAQQGPYVLDQNQGQFVDKYGNPIGGSRPGATPEAHIPYGDYVYQR